MNDYDLVEYLIEHYKNHLEDADIIFTNICTSEELPTFNLPDREVQLTNEQKNEFINRYSSEIAPLIRDMDRLK